MRRSFNQAKGPRERCRGESRVAADLRRKTQIGKVQFSRLLPNLRPSAFIRGCFSAPKAAGLIAALALWLYPASSEAIVVLKRGADMPIMGYLVSQDEASVVVREVLDGGRTREQRIERSEIEELLVTVDPKRLEALDPREPRQYLEYAEELTEKARDPEAREAAERLFHIAAWLAEGPVRQSSILGLAAMSPAADEQRRLEAIALLVDPQAGRVAVATLEGDTRPAIPPSVQPDVLAAVRLLRQGKPREAADLGKQPAVAAAFDALAPTLNSEQFAALCQLRELTSEHLRRLLTIELALLPGGEGKLPAADTPAAATWGQLVGRGGLAPLPSLDLLHLTRHDPRACLYREGKWQIP
jgi:hypothetical protein